MVLCRVPPALTICGFLSQTSDHEAARPNPAAATAEPSAAPTAAAQQPSPNLALVLDSPPNPVGAHPAPEISALSPELRAAVEALLHVPGWSGPAWMDTTDEFGGLKKLRELCS